MKIKNKLLFFRSLDFDVTLRERETERDKERVGEQEMEKEGTSTFGPRCV